MDRQYEEDQLKKYQALLKELEDELLLERDVKTKWKLKRDIAEALTSIEKCRARLTESAQPLQPQTIEALVEVARQHCCAKILNLYSTITLFNLKQIDVDQIFVDVYVLEDLAAQYYARIGDFQEIWRSQGGEFWQRLERAWLGGRKSRVAGEDIAKAALRLMMVGKPGSGKTTFLRRLAVLCCRGTFQPELIPILLELRSVPVHPFNLMTLVQAELRVDSQKTEALLQAGKVLLLLDGLDEVPVQYRQQVQQEINQFVKQFYANQFIITCRTQTAEYRLSEFAYVEVADFNQGQKWQFIRNWFSVTQGSVGRVLDRMDKRDATKLLEDIDKNKRLWELAGTPVLLSLICWVYSNNNDNLPQTRAALYDQGLHLLLDQWDGNRNIQDRIGHQVYRSLTVADKRALLATLAKQKFEQPDNFVLFEANEVITWIAAHLDIAQDVAREVLCAVEQQHGLLIERAQGIWSFSHLTFQEYFVAQWFVQRQDWVTLANNLTNPRWQEVFRLVVESQKPADALFWKLRWAIDDCIARDKRLQACLSWAQTKPKAIKALYKPAAIRAFYLGLALNRTIARDLDRHLDLDLDLDLALDRDLDRTLARALDRDLDRAFARAFTLTLDHALTHALTHARDLNRAVGRDRAHALDRALDRSDREFKLKLDNLYQKLPDSDHPSEARQSWWDTEGSAWIAQLREVMIEYRNIGHDWQFTESQKQALQSYYNANQSLVKLLQQPGAVSNTVREEIEETLLLPMEELRRQLPEMYGED